MSRHIAFVTTEYDPIVPGGTGAVVAGLTRRLRGLGNRVTIILVTDRAVEGVGEDVLVTPPSGNGEDAPALAASKAAFEAVRRLVDSDRIDLIEFQDFDGLGFWTVTHRHDTPLESTRIAVRYHLPADHILDAIGAARPEFDAVRAMERAALRGADAVIAQTPSMAGVIHDRYGIEPERIIAGPPPVLDVGKTTGPRSETPRFVVVGRLSEQKGDHDCVRALGPVLQRHRDVTIEFVGADGWSASEDTPMREWIPTLAPPDVRDRIAFTDPVPRPDLPPHLSGTWAVLVPSRLESFCLVAHEARAMGLPIIARDLEPITDYFSEATGALIYDGTDAGLRDSVESVLERPEILDDLAAAPLPQYPDPAAVYLGDLPAPRHPHSQAGHATAGIHSVAAVTAAPPSRRRRGSGAARRLLALLPEPVARAAVRLVPGRLKDRFRDVASWPAEMERRRFVERRRTIDRRIAAGDFPELDTPGVTVVIPCYNHGEYVEGAILSVFEQTFPSWEIVVVDDGSTDPETVRILDALDLPRVRVLRQANTGLPAARNAGISVARGKLIVPLDADDELLPRYLEELVDALDGEPEAAFAHCWAELFGDVNWVWATRPYNPYTEMLSNSVFGAAMFRRSAWDQVGGYDPTMTHGNEDWDLWLRFQEAGWGNVRVREPLYRYRKHGLSMSVDTEADFERGRERIRRRHPALYDPEAIRRSKAANYPLLSVVVAPDVTEDPVSFSGDDVQIVRGSERCDAVAASKGKYVVFWDGHPAADVWALVERLECDPRLGAATGGGETVYRRWELVDPDTGLELGDVPSPERCPDPEWIVPARMEVNGRAFDVVRQRPEEEGRLPRWLES